MIDVVDLLRRIYNKIYIPVYKKYMGACGERVFFSPIDSVFYYKNMYVGNDVHIDYHADMVASRSKIIIGNHVVFGPHVSIRGGDHRIDVVGKFIDTVGDSMKLPENDLDVVFEGDNWIGMNSTILKGVTIGRGCVVAAGAVVNKSTPPYSVVGGVPAKVLKMRFTKEQIAEHERFLYNKVNEIQG